MADRQYELVYILPPDTTEQQVTDLQTQVEGVVSKMHGHIEKTDPWGRKKLAYEIGRNADKKTGDKAQGQRRTLFRRRKVCKFCADKIDDINYKDVKLLGPFVPERGKILPRRISGTCAMHQRKLQTAIKRARQIALIPYVTD